MKKTDRIDDVLNRIGDYTCVICEEEISLIGVLRREENAIIFQSRMSVEHFQKLDKSCEKLQFWGNVSGILVTLMSAYFHRAKTTYGSSTYDVEFSPNEIIIGRSYREEPKVWCMAVSIPAMYNMFSQSPFDAVHNFSSESPYRLECAFPQHIKTADRYGHLVVFRHLGHESTGNEIKHTIVPVIEYRFNEATGIYGRPWQNNGSPKSFLFLCKSLSTS